MLIVLYCLDQKENDINKSCLSTRNFY